VPASNTRVDVPDVSFNTKVTWTDDVKSSQFEPSEKNEEGSVKARPNLVVIDQESVACGSSSDSEKSGLSDMAYDILAQQNRVERVCEPTTKKLAPQLETCTRVYWQPAGLLYFHSCL